MGNVVYFVTTGTEVSRHIDGTIRHEVTGGAAVVGDPEQHAGIGQDRAGVEGTDDELAVGERHVGGGLEGAAGSTAAQSAPYYYCPAGLVATGTADGDATGSNCSFWLLPSYPRGGSASPAENAHPLPGLDVLPVWSRTRGLLGREVPLLEAQVADRSEIVGAAALAMSPRP